MACWLAACSESPTLSTQENVLFRDEFVPGQSGDWVIEGDEVGQTTLFNEQLIIEMKDTPSVLQYTTLSEPGFTDFVLEVDVKQLAGALESSFGVLFRMQDPTQFYRFEVTGSGLYMVEKHNVDGTWTRFLDDWAASPAINQGLGAPNRLKVVAVGPNLSFFVNDVLLQQVSDSSYAAGTIALDAGTFAPTDLQVAFDNVVVKRP